MCQDRGKLGCSGRSGWAGGEHLHRGKGRKRVIGSYGGENGREITFEMWKKLSELESLHDDELDSDFVRQASVFCSCIFISSKVKTQPGGIEANGARKSPTQLMIASDRMLFGYILPT